MLILLFLTVGGKFLYLGPSQDVLYPELWKACAGPLVTLPREGERVYYFPQGHMEQVLHTYSNFCIYFLSICFVFQE